MYMLNLTDFYYNIIFKIPPNDRYVPILDIDDVIVINFDCMFDRDYALRGIDQLIYLAHKLGTNKRFLFLSEDGAILQMSGATEVIKNIIHCFNLNPTTCAVVSREDLIIDNATFIKSESIPFWCRVLYPTIKDIPIPAGPFNKKFAVWFHRGTFYRLQLAKYLYTNYKDDSYISYQENGVLTDRKMSEYFQDDIAWANANTPIVYDTLFPNRIYDFNLIAGADRKPYADYFLEITAETDLMTTDWITEKTVKNLYIGKPFIILSGAHSLEKIRSMGFKTFAPWIDESYDQIDNTYIRLETIKLEIARLANKSLEELLELHTAMMPIFEHNRITYEKYIDSR